MAWEPAVAQTLPRKFKTSPASSFFKNLSKEMEAKVDKVLEERTKTMRDVLRYRLNMGEGLGKYPKHGWMGGPTKQRSHKSYRNWRTEKRGRLDYGLINDTMAVNGYNYVKNLAYGTGWNKKIRYGKQPFLRLVAGGNGKFFSTQMPRGLSPWLYRQKKLTIQQLKEVIAS